MKRLVMCGLALSVMAQLLGSPCAAQSEEALMAKEKQAWEAYKDKNTEAFSNLLADDFIGFGDEGRVPKSREVTFETDLKDYSLSDMKVAMVNKDAALLTYKVTQHGTYKGQPIPVNTYASSVWVSRNGKWLAVMHQETPAAAPHTP